MSYVSLAIFSPLRKTFDYIVPSKFTVQLGVRVRAPFGKRQVIGIVVAISTHSNYQADKLKAIDEVLDEQAIISSEILALLNWASKYYYIPIGMLYKLALPKKLREGEPVLISKQASVIAQPNIPPYDLNAEQRAAFEALKNSLGSFSVAVLDGVTGSGKTEVYFKLIAECLAKGWQALILIPEINLGPQTIERLTQRFPHHNIGLLHSKITEKKRYEIWQQAAAGSMDIIIGTRLAAFTPLVRLGLIIIDEEHDLSFKQQDSCRYSAKDLLVKRAQLVNCLVLLGSATLSLETWQNAQNGKYQHYALRKRAGCASTPQIELIDTSHKKLFAGMSEQLLQAIAQTLAQEQQVFIFLNRRGFAPVLFCSECGWHLQCTKCSSNMIMHHKTQYMICHHCEHKKPIPALCPDCQNNDLNPVGIGTQRLELALKERFYAQEILRYHQNQ
jgi:primosomal protein N' (replication factor Y)